LTFAEFVLESLQMKEKCPELKNPPGNLFMDHIADMIIRIKNGGQAGLSSVLVPYSRVKLAVAQVLLKENYIKAISKKGKKGAKFIEIGLLYENGSSKIRGVKRVSKLSRRVYRGVKAIKPVKQGFGHLILSTPKGILTNIEAKKEKVGGEALFQIW